METNVFKESQGFSADLGFDIVDIFVGLEEQQFYVHKNIVCARVPYFQKMFCGQFLESEQQSVKLPEEDPTTFGLFLEWVYGNGRLSPLDISKNTSIGCPFMDRVKLYCFAERICLTELTDYLMTNLISNLNHHDKCPGMAAIKLAYEGTRPESPLRSYMSKRLALRIKAPQQDDGEGSAWSSKVLASNLVENEDILRDVIVAIRGLEIVFTRMGKKVGWMDLGPFCTWHSHPEGIECAFKEKTL